MPRATSAAPAEVVGGAPPLALRLAAVVALLAPVAMAVVAVVALAGDVGIAVLAAALIAIISAAGWFALQPAGRPERRASHFGPGRGGPIALLARIGRAWRCSSCWLPSLPPSGSAPATRWAGPDGRPSARRPQDRFMSALPARPL